MRSKGASHGLLLLAALAMAGCDRQPAMVSAHSTAGTNFQSFEVTGWVKELKLDAKTAMIEHDAIPDYMEAMTMAFRARTTNELVGIQAGDVVKFRLSVKEDESWIDRMTRTGHRSLPVTNNAATPQTNAASVRVNVVEGLAAFVFTNELGRAVNFADFKGQAIGLTFFFTRCPLPEFCPRLTKNFASATKKLHAISGGPTNWHFFSISFDPEVDSPAVLRSYARGYGYDSNRWSFLTSSQANIDEVARRFGFNFKKQGGTFTHHFFTVVLDAHGYWQTGWPIGGDTSDNLVEAMIKAAAIR